MAPIGRAGLLQLLCGTRKPRQSRGVPTAVAGTVVAQDASPEPEASVLVEPHARVRGSLASATASAPSLPRSSLRRQSSAIRTGCANERPSGSVRGVSREWYPYRDLIYPGSRNFPVAHLCNCRMTADCVLANPGCAMVRRFMELVTLQKINAP